MGPANECSARRLAWMILLPWVVGCATIKPPSIPLIGHYDDLARQGPGAAAGRPTLVYVEAMTILNHRPSPRLSERLTDNLNERLGELGIQVVRSLEQADVVIDCDVRGWHGDAGTSALVSVFTATTYTPMWYPWVIEVNLRDRQGTPIADVYERGRVLWHCWAILFFPTTIPQYYAVLRPKWSELTDTAAKIVAAEVMDLNARQSGQSLAR